MPQAECGVNGFIRAVGFDQPPPPSLLPLWVRRSYRPRLIFNQFLPTPPPLPNSREGELPRMTSVSESFAVGQYRLVSKIISGHDSPLVTDDLLPVPRPSHVEATLFPVIDWLFYAYLFPHRSATSETLLAVLPRISVV